MKNANIFVDVHLTLVDANLKLLPGARIADDAQGRWLPSLPLVLQRPHYAMKIAALHGLTDLFEAFAAKPDIIIDDMPGTAHPAFAFDVNQEPGWPEMVRDILRKHIDPR